MAKEMPHTELRRELQTLTADIEAERTKLAALVGEYTRVALKVADMAEQHLLPALDECGHDPKAKKVVYSQHSIASMSPTAGYGPKDPGGQPNKNSSGKGSGKRACSICRQPGHRAGRCPNKP